MTFAETVLLGALAGFTIYLGLPFGRIELLGRRARVGLAMFAVGVLAFLFVDVFGHAFQILDRAMGNLRDGKAGAGHVLGLVGLMTAGFAAGTAGLAMLEKRLRMKEPPPVAGGSAEALTADHLDAIDQQAADLRRRALRTGMTIAAAIGLHNFAEGLAIGVSASTGAIGLATVLIIGFALHNATEGFGDVRPSWGWLAVAGLVGGGPTFIGSIVGYNVTSEPLELAFYALSGGAILYVIGEVWNGMRRFGHRELGLWLLVIGFMVGVATDLVVVYGGA